MKLIMTLICVFCCVWPVTIMYVDAEGRDIKTQVEKIEATPKQKCKRKKAYRKKSGIVKVPTPNCTRKCHRGGV